MAVPKTCELIFDFTAMGGSSVALIPHVRGSLDDIYRTHRNDYDFEQAISGCLALVGPANRDTFSYSVVDWIISEQQYLDLMAASALWQKGAARNNPEFDNTTCFLLHDSMLSIVDCYPPQWAYVAGTLGTPFTTDAGLEMVEYCPLLSVTFETLPNPEPYSDGSGECQYLVSFSVRECKPLESKDALGATAGSYSTINAIDAGYDTAVSGPFTIAVP